MQCSADGTPDPESPYVKFKFRLYETREEAEGALEAFRATTAERQKETEAMKSLTPLSRGDGEKYQTRPFDWDAQRFWRD